MWILLMLHQTSLKHMRFFEEKMINSDRCRIVLFSFFSCWVRQRTISWKESNWFSLVKKSFSLKYCYLQSIQKYWNISLIFIIFIKKIIKSFHKIFIFIIKKYEQFSLFFWLKRNAFRTVLHNQLFIFHRRFIDWSNIQFVNDLCYYQKS